MTATPLPALETAPRAGGAPPAPPAVVVAGLAPATVPYDRGLELQRAAAEEIRQGDSRGTVLLLEHAPVYTAGRRSAPDEYPRDGTPVVPVDRGGKVTWHGPGQLVAYPVVRLRRRTHVVDFVRELEQVIIDVSAEFGVAGIRVPGRSGVWAERSAGTVEKYAQIGIHTSDGIVTHGLALNCCNDLAPFANFVPCGITDAGVTTLSLLAGARITPAKVAPRLAARLTTSLAEVAE